MKKLTTWLLIMCMCATMFVGCQSQKPNSSQASASGTEPSSEVKQEEKPVLKYIGGNVAWDPNSEPTNALLQEMTGYGMEYYVLPADNPAQKLNMELASGVEYDIICMEASWFDKLASQNALISLNDLIEKFAPNVETSCLPDLFDVTTRDGEIYGIPTPSPSEGVYWGVTFRKDILEDLGLEVPTDADSFYNCLKTIKEKTGIIPLTTAEPMLNSITSAFGISTYFKEVDGELVARPEQDGTKEYLKYMSMLYKEELLDNDMPINKAENVREKFTSGQAAAILMTYGKETPPEIIMPALQENIPDAELIFISPLMDKEGNREIPLDKGINQIVAIPKTSKNPEDAMKWINTILDEANSDLLAIGEEGVHYTKEDGVYAPILPKFFEDKGNSWWLVPVNSHYKFPTYWKELRIKKNIAVYDVYSQLQDSSLEYGYEDPTLLMPFNDVSAELKQKLTVMETDYYKRVISGAEDIANYDEFLEEWRTAGGTEMTAACNEWYVNNK